ncbi:MAG: nucleotidyltransferase domain-containing protein [Patescibacteria group bacterium]
MNTAIVKAQKFVDKVRESGVPVSTALVYGSWAKGKANKDSDIDVCVVSPHFGKDYVEEIVRLRKISLTVDSRIEPISFSPQDLKDPYGTLASEIRKFSISLN